MQDNKRKGNAGVLNDTDMETDPNPGIPATSAGGGLVEPGRTVVGSAPLGTGGAHADIASEKNMYGGPRAIDYGDDEEGSEDDGK